MQSDSFAGPSAGMMITQAVSAQQVIAVSVVTVLRHGDDDDKMTQRRSVATTFRGRPLTSCRRQDPLSARATALAGAAGQTRRLK